jgi:hypothetical protein
MRITRLDAKMIVPQARQGQYRKASECRAVGYRETRRSRSFMADRNKECARPIDDEKSAAPINGTPLLISNSFGFF